MVGTVHGFLQLVRRHQPEALETLQTATRQFGTSGERAAIAAAYRRLPAFDFSRDILTRGREALLVQPARRLTWSDWGEPARIQQTLEQIGCRPKWLTTFCGGPEDTEKWTATPAERALPPGPAAA